MPTSSERAEAPPTGGKRKKKSGPIVLAKKNIISPGPMPDTITIDFRHHAQCPCERCVAERQPKRRRRNGSR